MWEELGFQSGKLRLRDSMSQRCKVSMEVMRAIPFFSFEDDPERFVMHGLGPPGIMDPRLALLLSTLFADHPQSILRVFHIEEEAEIVKVRLASTEKSMVTDRFRLILSLTSPRYGPPKPPLPGIRKGEDPWALRIPIGIFLPSFSKRSRIFSIVP